MEATHEDLTRVYTSDEREWLPLVGVPKGEAWIKVIHADEERGTVIFKFRFGPGCELVPHTHKCHAIAYTISGEWEYEGLRLPEGAIAYEPVESIHTPSSGPGAELVVVLSSTTDQFLINHMPDGSEVAFDMGFFKQLDGMTADQIAELAAQMGLAEA
ncbi:MAG TPA: cupin domain-containing protein [Solirubrobacteraceae bacterium]|jgi:quercetin dioxygenase-like cupin family protein|nr:cupin domain-containing protein [Solirubrobacteraceae bacterium]